MKIIISLIIALGIFLGFVLAMLLLMSIKSSIGHILPFLKTTLSIQVITIVFIIWTIHILGKKWFNIFILLISFLIYMQVLINTTEYEIEKIALKKFNIIPKYIHINFDIFSEFKTPHAIVDKNGKIFYWSFRKNDFIFYYEYYYTSKDNPCNKAYIDNFINNIIQSKGQ